SPPPAYPFPNLRCIERTATGLRIVGPRPLANWEPLGSQNPSPQLRATFRYAPFAVGAALIWMWFGGVKRKIADVRQGPSGLKMRVKPIVLLCPDRLSGIYI